MLDKRILHFESCKLSESDNVARGLESHWILLVKGG